MSTKSIRSSFDLTLEVVINTGVLVNNAIVYVEFPNLYSEAMFFVWSPICKILD